MFKNEDGKQVAEPFAEQAKFFTECRLLQRDVKITLESVSNQNCVGSVVHPCGNIAELIVRDGFARLADWSMGVVSTGSEKLREAEKYAKAQKKRLWEGYEPSKAAAEIKDKNFQGKVVEILNGDGMMLKTADGNVRKIFLSSVRPPRAKPQDPNEEPIKKDPKTRPRPLYDVPYMYEAREFLRKKLVDKKVNVTIDYIQPKTDDYPEKTCCTVTVNGINVADALIGRGLATAVRYRQDDDQRSSAYYDLLAAEERAKKKEVGMFSKRESPVLRVSDTSGDLQKAKQFLPFLQRAGKTTGIVEFVASGSRLRIYIPKETCLITFLLSGIQCPRATRKDNATGAVINAGDPFGDAAMLFTKENVMQRDVEVTVESMDRAGNFIGWLTRDGMNMSVALVEEGLSKVHNTAEKSHFFGILQAAEAKAKARKANIWSLEQEVAQEAKPLEAEPQERKVNYKKVIVSYVAEDSPTFFAQKVQTGPELVALMEQMHTALANAAAPAVAYTPVKDRMCVAKYSRDNQWYRAVVQKVQGGNVDVFFIDYGNTDKLSVNQLAAIPNEFAGLPAQAEKYNLACVTMPDEEDDKQNAADNLYDLLMDGAVFLLNEEYTGPTGKHASLIHEESKDDIAEMLIRDGYFLAESRREKRLAKLVEDYAKAQAEAMANRKRIWQYGDFREDEAREFGYKK
jgi:staphylococcal nuclease domain-containing protein 1